MPRIQFSDVTPPEKRSIRNIPIPDTGRRKIPVIIRPKKELPTDMEPETRSKGTEGPYEYYSKDTEEMRSDTNNFTYGHKGRKRRFLFGGLALVLIVSFIIVMMTIFASATISIVPKTQKVSVDMEVAGATGSFSEETVRYEVLKLSESKTVSVPATGEEAVELKASGKIVIYNNFSTEPQRLIVRTRFESPEGLIYRIGESVIVPGKTIKGGIETPGSLEVEVFADEAGEKYNIKKTDFTIPGFKSDPARYKNFYARSLSNLTGGFIGKKKKVAETDRASAMQNLETEIRSSLENNLKSKVSEGLVLLSGSIIYKSKELPTEDKADSVILGKELTAYALMLNKQDLSDKIINEYTAELPNWKDIKSLVKDFSFLKINEVPDNFENNDKIIFSIKGEAEVLANIDERLVGQKLLGAPKSDAGKLMDEFDGIKSMTATIRPMWKRSFPQDASKIHVETVPN